MTNEEMINQISDILNAHAVKVSGMLEEQDTHVTGLIDAQAAKVSDLLEVQAAKMSLMIENIVEKRLDSLFDGYMLTREKQDGIVQKIGSLEERIELLEVQAV